MFFWQRSRGVVNPGGPYEYAPPVLPMRGIDSPLRLGIGPYRANHNLSTGAGYLTGMPFATGGPAGYHNWSIGPTNLTTGAGYITGSQRTQPQTG